MLPMSTHFTRTLVAWHEPGRFADPLESLVPALTMATIRELRPSCGGVCGASSGGLAMQNNDHGSWLSIWLLAVLFGAVLTMPLPGPTNWRSQLDMSHTTETWMMGLRLGSSR